MAPFVSKLCWMVYLPSSPRYIPTSLSLEISLSIFLNFFSMKVNFLRWSIFLTLIFSTIAVWGQKPSSNVPAGAPSGAPGANMPKGRMYGKIVDEKGHGVAYATIQLMGKQFDQTTKKMTEGLITGAITEDNGDFSLEGIPAMGEFNLKITFIGYTEIDKKVSFGLTMPAPGQRPDFAAMASKLDLDLGNITLEIATNTLETVTVVGETPPVELSLDKKIYRVDKLATAVGGSAEDALKVVPSLSVDIEGNLTLRNASPQVFVDGRPTTLSLSQIPSESIESVEVITNPSAKYDASGGQAGIVNIVLKKDKRIGYNGNVRVGGDTQGGTNLGGDINARESKINVFLSGNYNRRRGIFEGITDRHNLFGDPLTNLYQTSESKMRGSFLMGRGGFDWFMDNRNTLTITGNIMQGNFNPTDLLTINTDYLNSDNSLDYNSLSLRSSESTRQFRNLGTSVLFKHNFPRAGRELTADINFSRMRNSGDGDYMTTYAGSDLITMDRQESSGGATFLTVQTDYVNPINDKMKFEAGARAALRSNVNNLTSSIFDNQSNLWVIVPSFASKYNFDDNVFAAYGTFSHEMPKWSYQLGLRAESSTYYGELPESSSVFENNYPFSLFPSMFLTRKINQEDNLQLSYTRKVNRPNFFQLMPFTDFADSINLRRGNPDLRPEFTNSLELTYQNAMPKGHNLLVSIYYKSANDLITSYQVPEKDPFDRDVIVTTFTNANRSQAYGMEVTLKNPVTKWLDFTSNVNVYNSRIDASNVEENLTNEQFTYFVKENITVKLPAAMVLQVSSEYRSRAGFTPSSGSGGGRFGGGGPGGGGPPHGGSTGSAQGYSIPVFFTDVALRKNFMKNKMSLTLSMQDVFASRRMGTHSESILFIQDTERFMQPQQVRLNLSYRFGKMDTTLFKRKNTNSNSDGMDMMQ